MELNKNYRIVYDENNCVLQFFEQRESFKKGDTKRIQGSGETKEHTEDYYYPNLKTALVGFLQKCTWEIESAEEVLKELNRVELLIKNLK